MFAEKNRLRLPSSRRFRRWKVETRIRGVLQIMAKECVRCSDGLKAEWEVTETSLNRIIPKKAHDAIAQTQASKGSDNIRVALRAVSMAIDIGGRRGFRRPAWRFSSPRKDQLIRSWCESDNGGGHPSAMCQSRTADRYSRATSTETGSKITELPTADNRGSPRSGSATAHRAKEWSNSNDAGRRSDSGIENVSQKT